MTDPLIKQAREAVAEYYRQKPTDHSRTVELTLSGEYDDWPAIQSALSALRTQQAMIVEWFRQRADKTSNLQLMAELRAEADAIEQDEYLKGRG